MRFDRRVTSCDRRRRRTNRVPTGVNRLRCANIPVHRIRRKNQVYTGYSALFNPERYHTIWGIGPPVLPACEEEVSRLRMGLDPSIVDYR